MNNGYVAVIDSGIGGFSVLSEMLKIMPNENYIYFGDNQNAPYGNRTNSDLFSITMQNLMYLHTFNIKAIVFGCNTISTNLLSKVAYYFPDTAFFGVYPPVEMNLLHGRKVLMLCTNNTAKKFNETKDFTILALNDLALDVEKNMFNLDRVSVEKHIYQGIEARDFRLKELLTTKEHLLTTKKLKMIFDHHLRYFDVVILGCTHYFFVKNKIFNHFRPQLTIGGETLTAKRVKTYLENSNSLVKTKRKQVLFLGACKDLNKAFFEKSIFIK